MALASAPASPRTASPVLAGAIGEERDDPGQAVMRLDLPSTGSRAAGGVRARPVDTRGTQASLRAPSPGGPVPSEGVVRIALPADRSAALALQVPGGSSAAAPYPASAESGGRDGADRWSGDAWVFWRRGSEATVVPGAQGYGRSQAGAVIRLAMVPASALRPQAHLRASAALEGPREREIAAGISGRPLSDVPVRLAAEARVTETDFGTELRPAAFAVTEIPPFRLPAGLTGETYIQGGYVGGSYDTAFVDGQLGIAREFALSDAARFRLGAGMWGGAQRGVSRIDVGPSAQLKFRLGGVNARASADYRFRVAGNARPSSGPALTLSAGF